MFSSCAFALWRSVLLRPPFFPSFLMLCELGQCCASAAPARVPSLPSWGNGTSNTVTFSTGVDSWGFFRAY